MVENFLDKENGKIIIEPKTDFWSLYGSLKSTVFLSDKELKKARQSFSSQWAKK